MKRIEIDTGILRSSTDRISEDIHAVRTEIDSAYEGIRVLDTMWDGAANNAFNVQFTQDYQRLIEICDALDDYVNRLTLARSQYESGESSVADIVAAIRI